MDTDNNMISCQWQAKFRVKPSLIEDENVGIYNFKVVRSGDDKGTYVTVNYETNAFDEILPDSTTEYEYAEETLAHKHESILKNLILECMIYKRIFGPFEIKRVSGPTLINEKELMNEGLLRARTREIHLGVDAIVLDVGGSITESHNFWQSGFQRRSNGYENDVLRIADWLSRSKRETDEINSFILAWIAFNGLYGLFASITGKEGNDAEKFEHIIKELLVNEASNFGNSGALTNLESYDILSVGGNTNWSEQLKMERRNINKDDIKVLQYAMRCVYGVRKQVFHEAPQPVDIIERATTCKSILVPVAATCLKNFVNY